MADFGWKNIMVMGAGGVGGYFGARLAEGLNAKISLVARGEHLAKIQQNGLVVKSITGDFVVNGSASENPDELPRPDLILFTVKSYDTTGAIDQITGVVDESTTILPLQNGIENLPKLRKAFGDRVIQSLCRIGIRIAEPGVLSHTNPGSIIVGEPDGSVSGRAQVIKSAFGAVDVECKISENIEREVWKKFSWNSIFNMLTAAENVTTDRLYDGGEQQERLRYLADEILQVAKAEQVDLRQQDLEKIIIKTENIGTFVTSTLHDRRVGKKLEFDAFTGALLRLGKKHGLDMPAYTKLHAQLSDI